MLLVSTQNPPDVSKIFPRFAAKRQVDVRSQRFNFAQPKLHGQVFCPVAKSTDSGGLVVLILRS